MCHSSPLPPTFPDLPHTPKGSRTLTTHTSDNQDLNITPYPTQLVSSCLRAPYPSTKGLPEAHTRLLFLLLQGWRPQQSPIYPQALVLGGSYSQPPRLHLGLGEERGPKGAQRPERPLAWGDHSLSLAVPPSLAQGRQGQRVCWL